ncbi:cytochrome c oxidase assembly protein COX16-domain-containing protein [Suillus variegatus]|nr:cytochrome c oxidase assembly protein COX16-domain-containing protein [Suillus variegatus]
MPFSSKPINPSPLHSRLKRNPALFGVPFLLIIIGASFGLQTFTQTRYDLQDQKVKQMSSEQALGLDRKKKKFDIREEYYKLSAAGEQDWEPKRIARPDDFPELGVPPTEPPVKP